MFDLALIDISHNSNMVLYRSFMMIDHVASWLPAQMHAFMGVSIHFVWGSGIGPWNQAGRGLMWSCKNSRSFAVFWLLLGSTTCRLPTWSHPTVFAALLSENPLGPSFGQRNAVTRPSDEEGSDVDARPIVFRSFSFDVSVQRIPRSIFKVVCLSLSNFYIASLSFGLLAPLGTAAKDPLWAPMLPGHAESWLQARRTAHEPAART
jgi:hypothetical protein